MGRLKSALSRLRPSRRLGSTLDQTLGHPLIILFLATAILYVFLIPLNGERSDQFDQILFYFISGVSFMTATFILVRTKWKDWTILGGGLFGHFIAVGFAYFLTVWYAAHQIDWYTEELLILVRSVLLISGMLVSLGIILEWLADRQCGWKCLWLWIRHPVHMYRCGREEKRLNKLQKNQGESHEEAQTQWSE